MKAGPWGKRPKCSTLTALAFENSQNSVNLMSSMSGELWGKCFDLLTQIAENGIINENSHRGIHLWYKTQYVNFAQNR